jgi:hypothetical protein
LGEDRLEHRRHRRALLPGECASAFLIQ